MSRRSLMVRSNSVLAQKNDFKLTESPYKRSFSPANQYSLQFSATQLGSSHKKTFCQICNAKISVFKKKVYCSICRILVCEFHQKKLQDNSWACEVCQKSIRNQQAIENSIEAASVKLQVKRMKEKNLSLQQQINKLDTQIASTTCQIRYKNEQSKDNQKKLQSRIQQSRNWNNLEQDQKSNFKNLLMKNLQQKEIVEEQFKQISQGSTEEKQKYERALQKLRVLEREFQECKSISRGNIPYSLVKRIVDHSCYRRIKRLLTTQQVSEKLQQTSKSVQMSVYQEKSCCLMF